MRVIGDIRVVFLCLLHALDRIHAEYIPLFLTNPLISLDIHTGDDTEITTNWDETTTTFDAMDLQEELLRGIYAYGFEKPSAIQQVKILFRAPYCGMSLLFVRYGDDVYLLVAIYVTYSALSSPSWSAATLLPRHSQVKN
jgi:hypothetical protein